MGSSKSQISRSRQTQNGLGGFRETDVLSGPNVYIIEDSQEILESLQCKICYSGLVPPIRSCLNGHLVCSNCWSKMNDNGTNMKCGECRNDGGYLTRCPALDRVVSSWFVHCNYKCGNRFVISKLGMHQEVCNLRPFTCPFGCALDLKWGEVEVHFTQEHRMMNIGRSGFFEHSSRQSQGSTNKLISRDVFNMKSEDEVFYIWHSVHEFGVRVYVQSWKEHVKPITADITITGNNKMCKVCFTTVVGKMGEELQGPNQAIIAAETILGWGVKGAAQHSWKVHVRICQADK